MIPMYPYIKLETKCKEIPVPFPPQHQYSQPGMEYLMEPRPISENIETRGSGKLQDQVAIITGGDSGIGRAVAYALQRKAQILSSPISMNIVMHKKPKSTSKSSGENVFLSPAISKKNPYPKKSSGRQSIVLEKSIFLSTTTLYNSSKKASWIYQPNSLI